MYVGEKVARVVRPRRDTCSREVLRHKVPALIVCCSVSLFVVCMFVYIMRRCLCGCVGGWVGECGWVWVGACMRTCVHMLFTNALHARYAILLCLVLIHCMVCRT